MLTTGLKSPTQKRTEDDMNTQLGFAATLLTVGLLTAPVLAADEDYNAFNQAKTSLTQAIQTAEKAQGGQARAVDAEFDHDDGKSLYEIKVMSGDQVMTYHIDAVSGQSTKSEEQGALADFLGVNKVDPAKLNAAQTTLAQAIGGVHYEVTVLVGDEAREVEVDGSTGQVLKANR